MDGNDGFFGWLGSLAGSAIRLLVEGLRAIFGGLSGALDAFFGGLAESFGMDPGFFNYLWLGLGVMLLVAAARALLRRALVATIIWGLLAMGVLGVPGG